MNLTPEDKALRTAILESAFELFNTIGIKFTMADLAKDQKISKKTIYKVFRDKEALLKAMIDEGFQSVKEAEKNIYEDSDLDVIEKIKRLIIVMPERYEKVDFKGLNQLEETYPKLWHEIQRNLETGWDMAMDLLEQGIKIGRIRPIPLLVLKAMIEGTMEHCLSRPVLEGITYPEALEAMMAIIMDGITVKGEGK